MKKILITGGSGFIGYHVAKHLAQADYQIDIVDNFSRGVQDPELDALLKRPNVRLIGMDVLNPQEYSKLGTDYHHIYHFAAIIGVANVLKRPYAVLSDNVTMLLHMIDFARKNSQLQRFMFPSTSEVYAGTLQHFDLPVPTPESTPLALTDLDHPRTSYMLSKIYGEALCHHSGIPFTVIRPHNVYGTRMGLSHVVPELLKKAHFSANNGKLEVYSVNHKRTFCYVSDAVEQICRAMDSNECLNQVLNIGTQSPEITIGELASVITQLIFEKQGKRLEIVPLGETSGSVARRCPEMSETSRRTGYKSSVDLKSGVKMTYEWYQDRIFDQNGISAI